MNLRISILRLNSLIPPTHFLVAKSDYRVESLRIRPSIKGLARMARISLVIPLACRKPSLDIDIKSYRQALEEQEGITSVEVILPGEAGEPVGRRRLIP